MRKVEAEGQTKDEWTMVQCKYKGAKSGKGGPSSSDPNDMLLCNGLSNDVRDCEVITKTPAAFTRTTKGAKQMCESTTILMEDVHDRERNEDREMMRERNSRLDG